MSSIGEDRMTGYQSALAMKAPVRVATTGAITLSGTQTIDGVAVVSGDRVLVKNQVAGATNGIYVVDAGTWLRAPDCDESRDWTEGTRVGCAAGTVSASLLYQLTTVDPIVLGTTSLTFTAVTGDSAIALPVSIANGGSAAITAALARTAFSMQQNVITTRGDVVRGAAGGVPARFAIAGSSNCSLTSDGTDPGWQVSPNTTVLVPAVTTVAGSSPILASGIPSGVTEVAIMFNGVGTNGINNLFLRLGQTSGIDSLATYQFGVSYLQPASQITNGAIGALQPSATGASQNAADTHVGIIRMSLEKSTAAPITWTVESIFGAITRGAMFMASGRVVMFSTGELGTVGLVIGSSNSFDSGEASVWYRK